MDRITDDQSVEIEVVDLVSEDGDDESVVFYRCTSCHSTTC